MLMYTVAVGEVFVYVKVYVFIMDDCSKIPAVLDGSKRQTHRQTDRCRSKNYNHTDKCRLYTNIS